ncbi:MAG: aromatic ring-hydroxylating dioxygenase subunit alpha [Verrucomicrobiota bacterium]
MILPEDYLPRDCTFSKSDWDALSQYWYPVAQVKEISSEKPIQKILLDERLVIYRAGDSIVVAKDLCIHRGAPLSMGWIEGEEIVCPYHGFRYGKEGRCTRVPAQPDAAIPKKLCLVNFPAVERYGLVWTCLTGKPKRPIPEWPDAENPNFKHVHLPPQVWNAAAPRQVENFNDVAHLSWLHVGTFGNRDKPSVAQYKVMKTDYGLHFQCPYEYKLSNQPGVGKAETDTILYDYKLYFPFFTKLIVNYTSGRHYYIFDYASPMSARKTQVFFNVAQDYDLDAKDGPIIEFQQNVLGEDRPMVESQRPEEIPLDLTEEFHITADRFSTYFRRALKDMGLGAEMSG